MQQFLQCVLVFDLQISTCWLELTRLFLLVFLFFNFSFYSLFTVWDIFISLSFSIYMQSFKSDIKGFLSFFLSFFNDITVQSWWVSFFSLFLFYSVADELKRSRCLASVIFLKSNSHLKDFKKLNAKRNKIFKPF